MNAQCYAAHEAACAAARLSGNLPAYRRALAAFFAYYLASDPTAARQPKGRYAAESESAL